MIKRLLIVAALVGGCDDGGGNDPGGADATLDTDAGAMDGAVEPMDGAVDAMADAMADQGELADMLVEPDMGEDGPPAAYTTTCAPCHGPQGEGTALGYELQHPVEDYATWVVRNGRPAGGELAGVMAAYDADAFSDADLEATWAWLQAMPRAEDGEGLYLDFCGNCHGADGNGGAVREGARSTAQSIMRHVRGGEGGSNFSARERYMPAFSADALSDAELALIIDFLGG